MTWCVRVMHVHTRIRTHTRKYAHTHVHTYARMHTHKNTHTHTHTHTHHDGARRQKHKEDVIEEEARQKQDGGLEALEGDGRL